MITQKGRGRGSSRPKKENSERWLLTYSDLITLLLAFFVIMYGMSSADVQKFQQVAASMRRAFNIEVLQGTPDQGILDASSSLLPDDSGVGEGVNNSAQAKDLEMITQEMDWVFQQEGMADNVSIAMRPEGIAISISGNLLFASGKAELRPDAAKLLESVGNILGRLPNNVRIEGHTDDVPPSGTGFATNWELSSARSLAVLRYLTDEAQIEPARLSAAAYSQYQPVAPNSSPRTRGRNRRAEVLILYPTSQANSQVPGSQAPGSQVPGSQAPGSQAPGSQAPGSQAPGSQATGSQTSSSQASTEGESSAGNIER